MRIKTSLISGIFSVFRIKKLIFFMWSVNLIFGLIITLPVFKVLNASLAPGSAGDSMLQGFDYQWFVQFSSGSAESLYFVPVLIAIVGLVYMILQTFFAGGVISALDNESKTISMSFFFEQCSAYFGRFMLLWIIALLSSVAIYFICTLFFSFVVDEFIRNASTERSAILLSYMKYSIYFALFAAMHLAVDYAKIKILIGRSRTVFADFISSIGFVASNIWSAASLFLVVTFIGIGIWAVYLLSESGVNPNSPILIGVVFIVQQLYMVTRLWLRLLFYSTEYHFFAFSLSKATPAFENE